MVSIYEQVILDIRGGYAAMTVNQPALAATNSNIRKEVLPIFYGANKFLIEIGHADPYDDDILDYPAFINQIPHMQLMKRVGAYEPRRFIGGMAKLYTYINDSGSVEVTLEEFGMSWPACLCFTMREVDGGTSGTRSTTLAPLLMLACVRDLDKTMA